MKRDGGSLIREMTRESDGAGNGAVGRAFGRRWLGRKLEGDGWDGRLVRGEPLGRRAYW